MPQLATAIPTRKVVAAAITGGAVTIACWLVKLLLKVDVPGEVAAAVTTIVGFAVSYLTRPHARDVKCKARPKAVAT